MRQAADVTCRHERYRNERVTLPLMRIGTSRLAVLAGFAVAVVDGRALPLARGSQRTPTASPTKACLVRSLPVEGRVFRLGIHSDSNIVLIASVPDVGSGRPGVLRVIDYVQGGEVTSPSLGLNGQVVLSPSGRMWAFSQGGPSSSTLRVGAVGGADSRVCATSRFIAPLAFSGDDRVVVANSVDGSEHRVVVCDAATGASRSWPNTSVFERMKELVTIRLHGGPPWSIMAAQVSSDAGHVMSVRFDGQVVVWDNAGRRVRETTLPGTSDLPAQLMLADDGSVVHLRYDNTEPDGRTPFVVSDPFSGRPHFTVTSSFVGFRDVIAPERAGLFPTRKGGYVAYLERSSVVIVRADNRDAVGEIPLAEPATMFRVGVDGVTIALAHPGHVAVWRLVEPTQTCAPPSSRWPIA